MKKVTLLFLLLTCMLAGCGQKETIQETMPTPTQEVTEAQEIEVIPVIKPTGEDTSRKPTPTPLPVVLIITDDLKERENGVVYYRDTYNCDCIGVDKDGLLYVVTGNLASENTSQTIAVYDLNGKRKQKQVLAITTGKVKHLVVGENYLYLLGPETDCANVLYQIDLTTWEAKRLYTFTEFENVLEVVLLGDIIYVLAEYANVEEKEFLNYEDWYQGSEGEKRIVAYLHTNEETPELAVVPHDLPISIFKLTDTTLGIYATEEYTEEKKGKKTILEYSPTENTFEAWPIAHYTSELGSYSSFLGYEDGVVMLYNLKQFYYVDRNGTQKKLFDSSYTFANLPENNYCTKNALYANGFLFYRDSMHVGYAHRVSIEEKLKGTQAE